MKLVIQNVSFAACTIDNKIVGRINKGFMILVGMGENDNEEIVEKMANKVNKLRIFDDKEGKMNLDIHDVEGKILSISQFTLYADLKKGNRPSFTKAMTPERAKELYKYFNQCLRNLGVVVEEGVFGAHMEISLINNGPITIIMDSEEML